MEPTTSFEQLPRDVQLHVYRAMDMDARIRSGLVFKLHVPERVRSRLMAVTVPATSEFFINGVLSTALFLSEPTSGEVRYILRRFNGGGLDDIVICTIDPNQMELHRFNNVKQSWSRFDP